MESPEVPTEHLHEHLEHQAHHSQETWVNWVAVSTAIIAVMAAISSLMAGKQVNEAIVSKMEANDKWSEFGVKSLKGDVAELKFDLLKEFGKEESGQIALEKSKEYKEKKEELIKEAQALAQISEEHLATHERLASSVTLFQVSIAIAAISALTKRKPFWLFSIAIGIVGSVFLLTSIFSN